MLCDEVCTIVVTFCIIKTQNENAMRCFYSLPELLSRKGRQSVKLVSPFCKVNLCGALEFLLRKHSSLPSSSKETIEDIAQQHIRRRRVDDWGRDVMVDGENLFYILQISLRHSHPRNGSIVRRCRAGRLKQVRLMREMLLMFNV